MKKDGFTLVEIAVVLIVIGLLIGGVIKGVEIVENAKIKKTQTDFNSYLAAYQQFYDVYKGKPGDIFRATQLLRGCDPAVNFCADGDGNGDIGRTNTQALVDQTGAASPDVETAMFWKHLMLADMITGVATDANPANPQTGVTHPASSLGGAYSVYHRGNTHGVSIKACPESDVCGAGVIRPSLAMAFDTFYDGEPNAREGQIIANHGGCNHSTGVYDPDSNQPCYILFDIGR